MIKHVAKINLLFIALLLFIAIGSEVLSINHAVDSNTSETLLFSNNGMNQEFENLNTLSGNNTITYTIYEDYDPYFGGFLEAGEEVDSVALGNEFSATLTTFGRVITWGFNSNGQLGDGTVIDKYRPTDITSQFNLGTNEKITSISIGESHSAALTSTGRLFTWGLNSDGQLGNQTIIQSITPVDITSQFNLSVGETITKISLGSSHSAALTSTGRLFTWGRNADGQLGNNSQTSSNTPVDISSRFTTFNLASDDKISFISMGSLISTALSSKGRVFTWGFNGNGQLGNNTTTLSLIPIEITSRFSGLASGEIVTSLSASHVHNSALTSLGKVFTWGFNGDGRLGDGTTTQRLTPTNITTQFKLSTGETITTVYLGRFNSSALSSTGRVFTWGFNNSTHLDKGILEERNVPFDVTSMFNIPINETITGIALGWNHGAVKTSMGDLFTWGSNTYGQLGDGTTWDRLVPVNTTLEFDLGEAETIVQMSLGGYHSSALTSLGRIFTWGSNQSGRLGIGQDFETVSNRVSPTDITEKFNLSQNEKIIQVAFTMSHSAALTSTGRVFTWGHNGNGQLGDGTLIASNVPIDITANFTDLALNDIITSISLGRFHSSAVSSNGQVFMWGNNFYSQLGNGNTTQLTTPTNITSRFTLNSDEKVDALSLGENHSAARTSTGRMFTWGRNNFGQLGDGSTTSTIRNAPTNITLRFSLSTNETITSISLGQNHSSALTSTGRVFVWGRNSFGQIGDSSTTNRSFPTLITTRFSLSTGERVTALSLGNDYSSALSSTGQVFTWGLNLSAQLGDGSTTQRTTPTVITSQFNLTDDESITELFLGGAHSYAISSKEQLFAWGLNNLGQLGIDLTVEVFKPIMITNVTTSTHATGSLVEKPVDPVKLGYIFNGWYTDKTFSERYNFTSVLNSDIELFGEFITSVDFVKREIDNLPRLLHITLANEAEIVAVREAYDALTLEEQALVSNYQVLLDAEAKILSLKADQAIANVVVLMIEDFPMLAEITLSNEAEIVSARQAYDLLTTVQKSFVSNYQDLLDAETLILLLQKNAVIAMIDDFPLLKEITLADEAEILAARQAYNALPSDQKALVTNYQELLDAETLIMLLQPNTGPKLSSDLFISSLFHSGSSNVMMELFNGTGVSVNLSNYYIVTYHNGRTDVTGTFRLPNIDLPNNQTFLIHTGTNINDINDDQKAYINNFPLKAQSTDTSGFNAAQGANDVFILRKGLTTEIDIFGMFSYDPSSGTGWTEVGTTLRWGYIEPSVTVPSNFQQTLVRRPDVINPQISPLTYKGVTKDKSFKPSEWGVYPNRTFGTDVHTFAAFEGLNKTISRIDSIETPVSLLSKSAIEASRLFYDALPTEQKDLVSNYQALLDAEQALFLILNQEVVAVIALINDITALESIGFADKEDIEAARDAYNALNESQKSRVTNYNDLVLDEAALAALYADINAVIIAINAITPTVDLTVLDEDDVKAARALYDALTLEQQALVTNYAILVADEAKLAQLFADSNAVIAAINAITPTAEITLADKEDIEAARAAYNALSTTQKALITNLSDLVLDEAALAALYADINAVIIAINAITPTEDLTVLDEDDVKSARALYDALTLEQQALVTNYAILVADEAKLAQLFADSNAVIALINAITPTAEITLADKEDIEAARAAYNALSTTQKALITNLSDLVLDEAALAALYADINAVIAAINAITPTIDLTVLDEDDVKAARALYDALTEEQQALVTNYAILVADEAKLASLFDAIDDTIALINAITPTAEITLADKDDIEAARAAYNALSTTQKALITNLSDLVLDEAALAALYADINAVIIAINAITPTVDLTVLDEDDVKAARALYDALTLEQQALVTNYAILVADEAKLATLFADSNAVIAAINAITPTAEITLADKEDIEAARAAYEALSTTQKALITNLSDLVADEAALAALYADINAVIIAINAITPTIDLTVLDEDDVKAARALYDALTLEQQALVTNYAILVADEAKLAQLLADSNAVQSL
jgi:uncharacterized repeat protein (TIGR02543 family)